MKDLEALVDEYYEASGGDPRRIRLLAKQILDLVADIGLDRDAGIAKGESGDEALKKLDAYLCDLKEMQIRDGLHVFGVAPQGRLLTDLTVALARVPRSLGERGDASLHRAIAADAFFGFPLFLRGETMSARTDEGVSDKRSERAGASQAEHSAPCVSSDPSGHLLSVGGQSLAFDPLDCDMSAPWLGPRPSLLVETCNTPWRTNGDTVERIELLAAELVAGEIPCPPDWPATQSVLTEIETRLKPSILACGKAEIAGILRGLDGRFVAPGPSGAPTRGRPDVLPTGRNFYSVDSRAVRRLQPSNSEKNPPNCSSGAMFKTMATGRSHSG
ncbi:hypothetical protein AJ87_29900 [Rhizobium yanglingense]|nr:hypothetical protein AJ87_29900 [Rhizobium yanglingense]